MLVATQFVPVFDFSVPDIGAPPASQLACSEFQNCSSFGSDGTEFTGDNGFTVTDPNHPDSSWSSPSQLACSEFQHCDSGPDGWGVTYTGDNGWSVTDTYSCGSGDCGGYSVGQGASTDGTTQLGTYTDSEGTGMRNALADKACAGACIFTPMR